jgi:hypothetical protein
MMVQLDIYSGRPNPTWTLSPAQTEEIGRMLVGLPRAAGAPPEPGLGYRGFLLTNPERTAGLPAQVRVAAGTITIEHDGTFEYYRDVHGLERRLVQQASEHGYGDALNGLLPP